MTTNRETFLKHMAALETAWRANEQSLSVCRGIIDTDFICETIGRMESAAIDAIESMISDTPGSDWVSWHVYSNEFGAKKMQIEGRPILSAADLWQAVRGEK